MNPFWWIGLSMSELQWPRHRRHRFAPPRTMDRCLRVEELERRQLLAPVLTGIGVIGDSYTVERGGNNWTEQLAAMRQLNFGPATPAIWYQTHFLDYAYVLDGTPLTMNTNGALAALANQVAEDNVTLIYLDGVGRDFAARYGHMYRGELAGDELAAFTDSVIANLRTALETLSSAGDVRFVLENVGDLGVTPFILTNTWNFLGLAPGDVPNPLKMQLVTDAIEAANVQIQRLADEWGFPVVDQFALMNEILGNPNNPPVVGGFALNVNWPNRVGGWVDVVDPLGLWVDLQHVNPIPQGIKANAFLEAIRQAYKVDVAALSDQEILQYSYGRAGQTPPPMHGTSYFDISGYVIYNVAPIAQEDAAHTYEGSAVTIDVLANDMDPNGDSLSIVATTAPEHGMLTVNADQTITYSPDLDFHGGSDRFSYTISDGRFRTASATVTLTVIKTVDIDIKPDRVIHVTHPNSGAPFRIAILSTENFDAPTEVHQNTLTFGRTGNEQSLKRIGNEEPLCGRSDSNGDGRVDLVCHFAVQSAGFQAGDSEGRLKGQTFSDIHFEGSVAVQLANAPPNLPWNVITTGKPHAGPYLTVTEAESRHTPSRELKTHPELVPVTSKPAAPQRASTAGALLRSDDELKRATALRDSLFDGELNWIDLQGDTVGDTCVQERDAGDCAA